MSSSRVRVQLAGALALLALALTSIIPAAADQLLINGGFEQGTSGWNNAAFGACPARSGAQAATLSTTTTSTTTVIRQEISSVGQGSYTFSGQIRLLSGSPSVTVSLIWFDSAGVTLNTNSKTLTPGMSYTSFSLSEPSSAAGVRSLSIRIRSTSNGDSAVCLDDLSLEGPPPAGPASSTPSPTSSSTAIAATTTPVLTLTPLSATATATAVATQSASPTRTAVAAAPTTQASTPPTLSFVNGGFEQGLEGWQKFGGELRGVGSPHRSGSGAASLTSSTDSTKWAYQVVAVDVARAYQFSGYLRADSGVSAAYLRISWYASSDGSGQALATDDSTSRLSGASSDFVYLSTAAVTPPGGAHSARLRALLTPSGSASASIYLDDFAFDTVTAAAAQPTPRAESVVAPEDTRAETEAPPPPSTSTATMPTTVSTGAAIASATSKPQSTALSGSTASPVAQVLDAKAQSTPRPVSPSTNPNAVEKQDKHSWPVWPLAALAGLAGLGGAYVYARHKQP